MLSKMNNSRLQISIGEEEAMAGVSTIVDNDAYLDEITGITQESDAEILKLQKEH